jgi:hypothetical protein
MAARARYRWAFPSAPLAAALAGCSGESGRSQPGAEGEATGQVAASLSQVPAGVLCVQITVARGNVASLFNVMSGQSSASMNIGPLEPGTTTIRAAAFNLACASVTSNTTPDWIGSPISVDVKPGASSQVNLTLQPNVMTNVSVDFISPAAALGRGFIHTFAISAAGTVRGWGNNGLGQLGDGTTTSRSSPTAIPALASVASISGGVDHSCAVTNVGALQCWGDNGVGELGDGTTTSRTTPTQIIASDVKQGRDQFLHPRPSPQPVGSLGAHGGRILRLRTPRHWGRPMLGRQPGWRDRRRNLAQQPLRPYQRRMVNRQAGWHAFRE